MENGLGAAGLGILIHIVGAVGTDAHQQGNFEAGGGIDVAEVHLNAGLGGHSGNVDDGIAAADGHAGLDGVGDGLLGDDLSGSDLLGIELHDLLAGGLGQLLHFLASAGGAGVAGHRHADDLGDNGHSVAGAHHAAGAASRNRHVHQFVKVGLSDFAVPQAGLVGAYVDEVHILAPVVTRLHVAASNNHRGQVQTAGGHQ